MSFASQMKGQVRSLYKALLYIGREYPQGYPYPLFRKRCYNAIMKNKDVKNPEEIKRMIGQGQFVVHELNAMFCSNKCRALKRWHRRAEEEQNKMLIAQVTVDNGVDKTFASNKK